MPPAPAARRHRPLLTLALALLTALSGTLALSPIASAVVAPRIALETDAFAVSGEPIYATVTPERGAPDEISVVVRVLQASAGGVETVVHTTTEHPSGDGSLTFLPAGTPLTPGPHVLVVHPTGASEEAVRKPFTVVSLQDPSDLDLTMTAPREVAWNSDFSLDIGASIGLTGRPFTGLLEVAIGPADTSSPAWSGWVPGQSQSGPIHTTWLTLSGLAPRSIELNSAGNWSNCTAVTCLPPGDYIIRTTALAEGRALQPHPDHALTITPRTARVTLTPDELPHSETAASPQQTMSVQAFDSETDAALVGDFRVNVQVSPDSAVSHFESAKDKTEMNVAAPEISGRLTQHLVEISWNAHGYEPVEETLTFSRIDGGLKRQLTTQLSPRITPATNLSGEAALSEANGDAVPDGTAVDVLIGSTKAASGTTVDGTFSFDVSHSLDPGDYSLTVRTPERGLQAAVSTVVPFSVVKKTPTVTVRATPEQPERGDIVELSATVSGGATGTVTWQTPFERSSVPIVDGVSSTTAHDLPVGTHTITATYSGDAHTEAISGSVSVTVTPAKQTISLNAPANAFVGEELTLAPTSTGLPATLALHPDSTGCTLNNATVTFTEAGDCMVTATQDGDPDHHPADAVTVTIAVKRIAVVLTSIPSPEDALTASHLLFRPVAVVSSASGEAPAGSAGRVVPGSYVVLVDGQPVSDTSTDGRANFSHALTTPGPLNVSVQFTPADQNRYTSASHTAAHTVSPYPTHTTLSSSHLYPSVYEGDPVTLTARVENGADRTVVPAGSITFAIDGSDLATVALVDGEATYSLPAWPLNALAEVTAVFTPADRVWFASSNGHEWLGDQRHSTDPFITVAETSLVHGDTLVVEARAFRYGGPADEGDAVLLVDGVEKDRGPLTEASPTVLRVTDLAPGTYTISVRYPSPHPRTVETAVSESISVTMAAVDTTTVVGVDGDDITVAVQAVGVGRPTATGSVALSIDGAPAGTLTLVNGAARRTFSAQALQGRVLAAVYAPAIGFNPSSASLVVPGEKVDPEPTPTPTPGPTQEPTPTPTPEPIRLPTLTADLSSSEGKNRAGWYRTPVTVAFTCETHGVPLVGACPAPVVLTHGDGQSVHRTIRTESGAVATAGVSGVRVDTRAPQIRWKGLAALKKKRHTTVPKTPKCLASDATSGIASCTVTTTRKGDTVTWRAKAVDRAGNVTVNRLSVPIVRTAVAGATMRQGVSHVKVGRAYTFEVRSKKRPRYLLAVPAPQQPKVLDRRLTKVGKNKWAITVRFEPTMATGRSFVMGARAGNRTWTMPVRVS